MNSREKNTEFNGPAYVMKTRLFIKILDVVIGLEPSSPFVNQFGIILNQNKGSHMGNLLNGSKLLS